jgi:hypothetical protein
MRPAVSRFVFFAILYVIWIGYLAYLVIGLPTSTNGLSPILSRPQILVSDLDVVGTIDSTAAPVSSLDCLYGNSSAGSQAQAASATSIAMSPLDGPLSQAVIAVLSIPSAEAHKVQVQEVLFPTKDPPVKAGQIIFVSNFADCRTPGRKPGERPRPLPDKLGDLGPCLLPLRVTKNGDTWEVVPLPPSPGFVTTEFNPHLANPFQAPRIYPADAETRQQYREINKVDEPDRR